MAAASAAKGLAPKLAHGPHVWAGPEIGDPASWALPLQHAQLVELVEAARDAAAASLPLGDINATRYPLPSLQPLVDQVVADLTDGRGFVLLSGLPVFDLSVKQAELACWLLGTHIGIPVPQNAAGEGLVHVRDQGVDFRQPDVFGYQSHNRLDFHVDSSDVVALLCRRVAKTGGESRIVSSAAVHNEMVRRHPNLAAELYGSFAWDRRRPIGSGDTAGFFWSPIFSQYNGRLSTRYGRSYLESAQRHPNAPRLSARQVEALDLLDELSNSAELYYDMVFKPGDIQLLNNYLVLHSRTEYEDTDDPDLKRDLVRLWLTLSHYPPLAADFASAGLTPRDASFSHQG